MRSRQIPLILLVLLSVCFMYLGAVKPGALQLPVLMYHHIVLEAEDSCCNEMTVTTGRLESDLQWLNERGYQTILPRDLVSGNPLPDKPVLITFDDGYRSNYELAYPLLQKYHAKAVISLIVFMPDHWADDFLSWEMCREMEQSGLVEIGSHSYQLHALDQRAGCYESGGVNGVQRKPGESDAEFQTRVLDDLQKSRDLIAENLGHAPLFFAYPFGVTEPDAADWIASNFSVTAVTGLGRHPADLSRGFQALPRYAVTMDRTAAMALQPSLLRICKNIVKDLLGI